MKVFIAVITSVLITITSSPAHAWWDEGHMEVAAKAYWLLKPDVRSKVDALIRVNKDFGKWTAGFADPQKPEIAFTHAATWPDDIKKDGSGYKSDSITGNEASQNIGYTDLNKHAYWHFIDIPFSTDETTVAPPARPNALTQIEAFATALASSTTSDDIKSYDLVWLLHLVGDVHQPVHATARFSKHLADDRGGNDERVVAPGETEPAALHLFWDALPGTSSDPMEAIKKAKALPAVDPDQAAIIDPATWVIESFSIAQNDVYTSLILDGEGPFALTQSYVSHAQEVADQRVALAGARLAVLLNAALK